MAGNWARRVLVTVTAAAAALCAGGTVAAGPVPVGGGGVCMPWPDSELAAVTPIVSNDGPAPVTITHLAVRDPIGMTMEAAYLVPDHVYADGGRLAFGFGPFPPLAGTPELTDEWNRRATAIGTQIPPGESRSLVIAVRRVTASQEVMLTGFDIAYADAGRSHRVALEWDVRIVPDPNGCLVASPEDL